MAPSSLKKMSGVRGKEEGNYASLEKISGGSPINGDLGLTLLPGSQIQRKDEKRLGTAGESSPKNPSNNVERLDQWTPSETEIQPKHPAQEGPFYSEAKGPSSSPDPGPGLAKLSNVMAREPLFYQDFFAPNSTGVRHHDVESVAVAPHDEQKMGTGETRVANSCQHNDSSPRAAKRRKTGSRASDKMRASKVSEEKEAAFGTYCNDQNLSEVNFVHSEKSDPSFATIQVPLSGSEGSFGSSKVKLRRQTTHMPVTVPAHSHQSTNSVSEDTALRGNSFVLAGLASRSPIKYQYTEPEKLTAHYQSSKSVSAQHWKHSRLIPDTPADIRRQVLKPRKEVNRSWTRHFPAKAHSKILRRANLPASYLLTAQFTPSTEHHHPQKASLTSTNLHAFTHISSTHPSPSLPNNHSLSQAFDYPSDAYALEDIFDTTHASSQCQPTRKRATSLPNLLSTCSSMNMESSSNFRPASMPTPPRDQASSPAPFPCSSWLSQYRNAPFHQNLVDPPRDHVDTSLCVDKSSAQNWQSYSNFQYQHEASLSDKQNMGFSSDIHPRQASAQFSNQQHVTGPSMPSDSAMAAGGPNHSRRRLEVQSSYNREDVKSLMFSLKKRVQTLEAENTSLQSSKATMEIDFQSLQKDKADMIQQIQRFERTVAQKNQQIKAMHQKGCSLQDQYKRTWDQHHRLLATIRKEDGTGKPGAIAQKIRSNHSPNTPGAASQGGQPHTKAYPVHSTNVPQLPISSDGFEQTPAGFQGHIQPVSLPGSSEANVTNASSWSLGQLGYAAANHNDANPSQTMTIPAESETDVVKSLALSQPGFAAANHNNAKSPQQISIPTYQDTYVANASSRPSGQPVFTAATHNSENPPHDGSTRWIPSNQPLGARVPSVTTNGKSNNRPMEKVPTERVTIDLTDDSQPSSSSASPDASLHPRMAKKPLLWLKGFNPNKMTENSFDPRTRAEQQSAICFSQSDEEEHFLLAQPPEAGSVAPLPETATGRNAKKKVPKKMKVVLDDQAKKERAKVYRKTAAERKKREKENAKQLLQDGNISNNAMRAHKQDRRAAKGEKRQERARKPSEGVIPRELQKTLDGRLYQEDTGVQQAIHGGDMGEAAFDDNDSLFGDSEVGFATSPDTDTVMHDDDPAAKNRGMGDAEAAAFVSQVEAEFFEESEEESEEE